mmetsp:Transcript_102674/g.306652  ORF Transcript_102674/g.306652 Transcript_102674/m.306652 type:complete len:226 (-) Transcript_102674:2016-2693(-)
MSVIQRKPWLHAQPADEIPLPRRARPHVAARRQQRGTRRHTLLSIEEGVTGPHDSAPLVAGSARALALRASGRDLGYALRGDSEGSQAREPAPRGPVQAGQVPPDGHAEDTPQGGGPRIEAAAGALLGAERDPARGAGDVQPAAARARRGCGRDQWGYLGRLLHGRSDLAGAGLQGGPCAPAGLSGRQGGLRPDEPVVSPDVGAGDGVCPRVVEADVGAPACHGI